MHRLHETLSASAESVPDRVAVEDGERAVTYAELADLSDRLASTLVQTGVEPGDRVGLLLPKSLEAVASIFAVLKAGGVYVPIDRHAPAARAALIVRDCGIRHLVASPDDASRLGESEARLVGDELSAVILTGEGADGTRLEGATAVPWDEAVDAPRPRGPVDGVDTDLAYILYTSGSTGTPKGVMLSHRAALSFVDWSSGEFGLGPDDVVSSHAPLHFDLSIFDIFSTVASGGTVVLVPRHVSAFPMSLTELVRDRGITCWYSVPSALIQMLTRGGFEDHRYPHLRVVLFAGEVFPVKYLRRLQRATSARLCNLYGPTETNVCTFHEVGPLPPDREDPVPIGTAVDNFEVFALDDEGSAVEPGETGELYARGGGVMSGYWGDPEKTDEVLVEDPRPRPFRERVVRTGDLVTLNEDGEFVFLGRKDRMIKSRGYRIEPGEVEAALDAHPRVHRAAVVAVPDPEVTSRLKAVIEPADGEEPAERELRAHCAERLPRYMVPETVELRASLPLTSTGKIDRRELEEA